MTQDLAFMGKKISLATKMMQRKVNVK